MIDPSLVLLLLVITVLLVVGCASSLGGLVLLRDAGYWRRDHDYAGWRRYHRIGLLAISAGVPSFIGGLILLDLLGRTVAPR